MSKVYFEPGNLEGRQGSLIENFFLLVIFKKKIGIKIFLFWKDGAHGTTLNKEVNCFSKGNTRVEEIYWWLSITKGRDLRERRQIRKRAGT